MLEINYLAIVVVVVAAFVVSSGWYIIFGNEWAKQRGLDEKAAVDMQKPESLKMLGELVRSFVVAFVISYLLVQLDIINWIVAAQLGLLLWIGFPAVLLAGSVMWDNVPWKLAAIHGGDWLVKLLLMAVILGVWR